MKALLLKIFYCLSLSIFLLPSTVRAQSIFNLNNIKDNANTLLAQVTSTPVVDPSVTPTPTTIVPSITATPVPTSTPSPTPTITPTPTFTPINTTQPAKNNNSNGAVITSSPVPSSPVLGVQTTTVPLNNKLLNQSPTPLLPTPIETIQPIVGIDAQNEDNSGINSAERNRLISASLLLLPAVLFLCAAIVNGFILLSTLLRQWQSPKKII